MKEKHAKFNIPALGTTIRVYTSYPKEIKLNDFMMLKLAESRGTKILEQLMEAMSLYLPLSDFLRDFSYEIDEIDYLSITDDYMDLALDLC